MKHQRAQALAQLPERDRAVLELRFLEDLSDEQTAARLHLASNQVRVIRFRALVRLKTLLPTEGPR